MFVKSVKTQKVNILIHGVTQDGGRSNLEDNG